MRQLAATAQRLRVVRQACRHFLGLWAMDCLLGRPAAIDRVASDLEGDEALGSQEPLGRRPGEISDFLHD